jgi:hypothetical protein
MRGILRFILLWVVAGWMAGCTATPREQRLTGEPSHERHAAGYKSQNGMH